MAASATGRADSKMSSRGDLPLPRSMVNLLRLIEKMMAVDQIGVTEVARRLEMPVATAFRLLKVLEHCGYAEQVPDSKQYRLTLKLFEIGCHVASRGTIRDLAAVEMDRLARQTGLAVNLGVLAGGDVLYIHKVQTDDEKLILDLPPGTRVPAHCTAMGKAMLAFARGSLRELVGEGPYDQLTEHSISSYEQLERELEEVRRAGYAVDRQELQRRDLVRGGARARREGQRAGGDQRVGATHEHRQAGARPSRSAGSRHGAAHRFARRSLLRIHEIGGGTSKRADRRRDRPPSYFS